MTEWFSDPKVIWFGIGLVLLICEFFMPGMLVLLFFGLGAWATMLCLFAFPINLTLQLTVFLVASICSLVLFRSRIQSLFFNKRLQVHNFPDSLQSEILGQSVDVAEDINPPHPGRVFLHGALWQAVSAQPIPAGARARIIGQTGLTLTVEQIL